MQIIEQLEDISDGYDAVLCDLWGCVHDGVAAFPDAMAALQGFRAAGGKVVMLTNAPRPRASVATQLDGLGVPRGAWDLIVTSGDSARAAMFRGIVGKKVWFMGEPRRDAGFFERDGLAENAPEIEQVSLEDAEGIVCCGPFDPLADVDELRPQLLIARELGLKLLCANPDIVVDRGHQREWCAGAVAKLYEELGGESLYFGKPHPPIYDLARRELHRLDPEITDGGILAIGDGILTDIRGALGEDLDAIFITGGLAAKETNTKRYPDPDALHAFLAAHQMSPRYAMGFLR
ncbi:MAG: TIGR01459 family HAD-type hydrolase [Pseudomonadota bacterium]